MERNGKKTKNSDYTNTKEETLSNNDEGQTKKGEQETKSKANEGAASSNRKEGTGTFRLIFQQISLTENHEETPENAVYSNEIEAAFSKETTTKNQTKKTEKVKRGTTNKDWSNLDEEWDEFSNEWNDSKDYFGPEGNPPQKELENTRIESNGETTSKNDENKDKKARPQESDNKNPDYSNKKEETPSKSDK